MLDWLSKPNYDQRRSDYIHFLSCERYRLGVMNTLPKDCTCGLSDAIQELEAVANILTMRSRDDWAIEPDLVKIVDGWRKTWVSNLSPHISKALAEIEEVDKP